MKIMERTYISRNGVVEKTRYAVGDNAMPRRKKKKGHTSFRKQEANFNCALRTAARILNCNFSHEDGLLISLNYSEEGLAKVADRKNIDTMRDKADHQMMLWLRRIRRMTEGKIKFLAVTSDIDGDTGECVRVHHHIVMSAVGLSWDKVREAWKLGTVDIRPLRDQQDYTPVATYLMRQVRRVPDKKKYHVSRGMLMPEISEREVTGHAQIKAPAGAYVLEQEYQAENITQYIRYKQPEKRYKRGGRKNGVQETAAPENPLP